jgi:protein arginine kinase activator
MLCELCKHNDAEAVLHRKDENGEDEELYVCRKCLAANDESSLDGAEINHGDRQSPIKPTVVTVDGEPPPEFIQNFLDAAVGLIEGVVKSEKLPKEPKCRVCGSTWTKIKETRALGCPDCWSQFAADIQKTFLAGAYGRKHAGKIPEHTSDGKPSRAFLERELKDAVARQNYRKAAKIRKQLDALEGDCK